MRLAEEALVLDPNDPRVHFIRGFVCLHLRRFARAERQRDLARTVNPNDPTIQIGWGGFQGYAGRPEQGLTAAEIAFQPNPRHPGWYESFLARLLFQLRHYAEAAPLLEQPYF